VSQAIRDDDIGKRALPDVPGLDSVRSEQEDRGQRSTSVLRPRGWLRQPIRASLGSSQRGVR
jgi:hypothetical protein